MTEPAPRRSVTIDRRRRDRLVRDLVRLSLRVEKHGWRVGRYWREARHAVRNGLDVGQTVSLSYDGPLMTLVDATGRLDLPRGSARVHRFREIVTVQSPELAFVLPAELLTEGDVAFLTGRDEAGAGLPLSLEVTQEVQDDLVRRATRVVAGSADFLLTWVAALAASVLAVVTREPVLVAATAVFVALSLPGLVALVRLRRRFRRTHPVGRVLRAEVTPEHLAVSKRHGVVVRTWDHYTALRVADDAVLIRVRRPPLARNRTQVLPRALFGPADLARLEAGVPDRF